MLRFITILLTCMLAGGLVAQASNGAWTATAGWSARQAHATVEFHGRLWVIGGRAMDGGLLNDVWSSPDGAQWTLETAGAQWSGRMDHAALVFNNRIWLTGGGNGWTQANDIWSSADGVT